MRFSPLADSLTAPRNPLYVLHDEVQSAGNHVLDLVKGNVNEHGIVYPQEELAEILREASAPARVYHPDSFGQLPARETISAYYDEKIAPSHFILTPGTSVSYWYCFKLLAEEGDEILTPQPSYPLFDYIARLCGVKLTHYPLDESRNWAIDVTAVERQINPRTRAIVLISPHNPTGMVASQDQLEALAEVAVRHDIPIISDEVFSEFLFGLTTLPRPAFTKAPLVFTLNGLSKMFALPGMKLGWIGVSGNAPHVHRALSALEMISDTFLPVNEIVQFATPKIFARGRSFLDTYRQWVSDCRNIAMECLQGCAVAPPEGGFYSTLQVSQDEEEASLRLLREKHILVHPGYFYDIEGNHLVMTFIHQPERIREAFTAIAEFGRG